MSNKDIIIESESIVESTTDENKRLHLYGVFMEAGVKNRNGNIYDLETIENVAKKINESAQSGSAILGELDHPNSLTISAKNVAIQLKEAEVRDNKLYCKAMVLPTPAGKIVKDLVESGVSVGVSSRGAGRVNNGHVSDYTFVTVDVVVNPSVRVAQPESIYEGYQLTGGTEMAKAIQEDVEAQEYFKSELLKALKDLSK